MTDERLERIIGALLRTGVILSAAVVLAGGIWYLASSADAVPPYRHFQPHVRGVHALAELPPATALILVGMLILIATPVARVVFALVGFALEGDRAYMVITGVVLVVLMYSLGMALA